ncbi:MAG: hypothetical protein KH415_12080 [Clostridium sp.]|nr:hypothetical protein [Clostridium sp.]
MKIKTMYMTEEEKAKRVEELMEAGHDEETIKMTVEFEDAGRKYFKGGVRIKNPEKMRELPERMARALLEVQGYKLNY